MNPQRPSKAYVLVETGRLDVDRVEAFGRSMGRGGFSLSVDGGAHARSGSLEVTPVYRRHEEGDTVRPDRENDDGGS